MVREEEPPTAEHAAVSTADALPSIAANRGTEPAKLTRLMRGELDWIVMKALEKDRTRRYETANGFARTCSATWPTRRCRRAAVGPVPDEEVFATQQSRTGNHGTPSLFPGLSRCRCGLDPE